MIRSTTSIVVDADSERLDASMAGLLHRDLGRVGGVSHNFVGAFAKATMRVISHVIAIQDIQMLRHRTIV
jgi:hypothetical protein